MNTKKSNYFIITLCLIVTSFYFSSCLSIIANKTGLADSEPNLQKLYVENKEVYFLSMMHLANKEFYENTKKIIEGLETKGFIVYAESISKIDSGKFFIDTIAIKKMRKIIGLDITIKYLDNSNPYLKKLISRYDLINQPSYKNLGAKTTKRVDYDYAQMINLYENKYGIITLDSCDTKTQIGNVYDCNKLSSTQKKKFDEEIILGERNKLVAKTIFQSSDKKILVIYGKLHYNGLKKELENLQNNIK